MVLPLLGALAGAGGGIFSAIMGANAQNQATQYNWMANLYNLAQRRRERQESMQYADELRKEQQLGGTDAHGNRTYFKPGEGWVTELADDQQALLDEFMALQGRQNELADRKMDFDNQQFDLFDYFTQNELPKRQEQFQRQARRSETDDQLADSFLDEYLRTRKGDPRETEALLYDAQTRGISEGMDDVMGPAMRSSLRTGSTSPNKILSELSNAAMKQRGEAGLTARLEAKDYNDEKFNRDRTQALQLYQGMADRSDRPLGASYDPAVANAQPVGGDAGGSNALMTLFSQLAQQGNSQGLATRQMTRGNLQNIEPDMSFANAAGAIGASLGGLGERVGSRFDQQNMNNLLMDYLSGGNQINIPQGGIFGTMANRLRAGGSAF